MWWGRPEPPPLTTLLRKPRDAVLRARGDPGRVRHEIVLEGVRIDVARDAVRPLREHAVVVAAVGEEAVDGDAIVRAGADRKPVQRDVADLVVRSSAHRVRVGEP